MKHLNVEEVIYIYTEIIQRSGGQPGIRDENMLDDVLAKPMASFEGEELYPDVYTKAAVLMYAMINNRPFVDGNKRIAVMCVLYFLRTNGYHMTATQDNLIDLAVGTEAGRYKVDQLIAWFKKSAIHA